jgi:MFS family permease
MDQPRELSTSAARGRGLALAAALLGWLFDGMEMGVFSLVARPAMTDLLGDVPEGLVGKWIGVVTALFLIGAATGGVLFGWLGDRIGRVRAMTLSVLCYAIFTGLCGFATDAWQLAVLRCIASLGMGGEWALGVSLVMEIWPNRSRAWLAGLIGAAANVGYLLIAVLKLGLAFVLAELIVGLSNLGVSSETIDWLTRNQGWRILMMFGAAPAILTFLIRLFVPESEKWSHEQARGGTSHWAAVDLLGVLLGASGPALIVWLWANPYPWLWQVLGTLLGLAIAVVGYTFPVMRYLQRQSAAAQGAAGSVSHTIGRMALAAGLSGVPLVATWAGVQWAPAWVDKLTGGAVPNASSWTQFWSAAGAIIGTVAAALLGGAIGRRSSYALMCIAAFASLELFYLGNHEYGPMLLASVFLLGFCTASFYGWLPLYLPELFPTRVRATGQGFGFNFGRILAAVGALQTGHLINTYFKGEYSQACSIMGVIYLAGLVLIAFAPETHGKPLPD